MDAWTTFLESEKVDECITRRSRSERTCACVQCAVRRKVKHDA